MNAEFEFMDIIALTKIGPESTVETFGPKINSSFFEAANLLGSLKIKGFIEIHSSMGNSPIILSEKGREIIREAEERAKKNINKIDKAVIAKIGQGIRSPKQISEVLNVSSSAIAYSLYRLYKKNMIDYRIYNGHAEVRLTEEGFESNPDTEENVVTINRGIVNKKGEIRNKVAEELAKEEIVIDREPKLDPQRMMESKIKYYVDRYWIKASIAIFVLALIFGVLIIILR